MFFSNIFPKLVSPVRNTCWRSTFAVIVVAFWHGIGAHAAEPEPIASQPEQSPGIVVLALRPPHLPKDEVVRLQSLAAALRETLRSKQWKVWSAEATKAWLLQTQLSPQLPLEPLRNRIHRAEKTLGPTAPQKAISHLQAALADLHKLNTPTTEHLILEQSTRIRTAQLCLAFDLCETSTARDSHGQASHLQDALFAQPQLVLSELEFAPSIRQQLERTRSTVQQRNVVDIHVMPVNLRTKVLREGIPLPKRGSSANDSFPGGLTRLGFVDDGGWWYQGRWALTPGDFELHIEPWLEHHLWPSGPGLIQRRESLGPNVLPGPYRDLFPRDRVLLLGLAGDAKDKQVVVTLIAPSSQHQRRNVFGMPKQSDGATVLPTTIVQKWPRESNLEQVTTPLAKQIDAAMKSMEANETVPTDNDEIPPPWLLGSLLGAALGTAIVSVAVGATWYFSRP